MNFEVVQVQKREARIFRNSLQAFPDRGMSNILPNAFPEIEERNTKYVAYILGWRSIKNIIYLSMPIIKGIISPYPRNDVGIDMYSHKTGGCS